MLIEAVAGRLKYEKTVTTARTPVGEALALGRGVCQDFAHLFLAACRGCGLPARYVSGYVLPGEDETPRMFAWAEAIAPKLGWIAFDPVHDLCPNASYVRVAVGLDATGAAPFRGSHSGGGDETVTAALRVEQAIGQGQQ